MIKQLLELSYLNFMFHIKNDGATKFILNILQTIIFSITLICAGFLFGYILKHHDITTTTKFIFGFSFLMDISYRLVSYTTISLPVFIYLLPTKLRTVIILNLLSKYIKPTNFFSLFFCIGVFFFNTINPTTLFIVFTNSLYITTFFLVINVNLRKFKIQIKYLLSFFIYIICILLFYIDIYTNEIILFPIIPYLLLLHTYYEIHKKPVLYKANYYILNYVPKISFYKLTLKNILRTNLKKPFIYYVIFSLYMLIYIISFKYLYSESMYIIAYFMISTAFLMPILSINSLGFSIDSCFFDLLFCFNSNTILQILRKRYLIYSLSIISVSICFSVITQDISYASLAIFLTGVYLPFNFLNYAYSNIRLNTFDIKKNNLSFLKNAWSLIDGIILLLLITTIIIIRFNYDQTITNYVMLISGGIGLISHNIWIKYIFIQVKKRKYILLNKFRIP